MSAEREGGSAALREPRSALRLIGDTFRLYRGYPLLFPILAAAVLVPYQLVVLAAVGEGLYYGEGGSIWVDVTFSSIEWFVIGPLISALHVHAVADVREGRQPQLGSVARRGLQVLPTVVFAATASGLGITAGFFLFLLPGLYLLLRWFVVSQAAAIEDEGWRAALRRSTALSEGNFFHIGGLGLCTGAITVLPGFLLAQTLGKESAEVPAFLLGLAAQTFFLSFVALATALLYFDLRARRELLAAESSPSIGRTASSNSHSLDPQAYTDETRPKGWYIDPTAPRRMRYWQTGDAAGWRGTARTPRQVRREWKASQRR